MDQTEQKSTLRNVTQPTVQQRPCQAKHAGCGDEKRLRGANRPDVALLPGFEGNQTALFIRVSACNITGRTDKRISRYVHSKHTVAASPWGLSCHREPMKFVCTALACQNPDCTSSLAQCTPPRFTSLTHTHAKPT